MAYISAPVLLTIIFLKGHSPVEAFSSAIRRAFVQNFTRFQLTACSRGHSATAGLLVPQYTGQTHRQTDQQIVGGNGL